MSVSAIPEGYHSVTAYLTCDDCVVALDFYKAAFSATETLRLDAPDGKIAHAEFVVGNSPVMLADEIPEAGNQSPKTLGGAAVSLMIYCDDCDALFAQAVAAGATAVRPVEDQFYGDRAGTVKDPFGHVWTIATHIEDVSNDEVKQRMQAMFGG